MTRSETSEECEERLAEKQAAGAGCHDETGPCLVDDECDGNSHTLIEEGLLPGVCPMCNKKVDASKLEATDLGLTYKCICGALLTIGMPAYIVGRWKTDGTDYPPEIHTGSISRVTTEKTCKTYNIVEVVKGVISRAQPYENESGVIKISLGDFCVLRKAIDPTTGQKPRPAAQDVDKVKPTERDHYIANEIDDGADDDRHEIIAGVIAKYRVELLDRPSLPVSAEVEPIVPLYKNSPRQMAAMVCDAYESIDPSLDARKKRIDEIERILNNWKILKPMSAEVKKAVETVRSGAATEWEFFDFPLYSLTGKPKPKNGNNAVIQAKKMHTDLLLALDLIVAALKARG